MFTIVVIPTEKTFSLVMSYEVGSTILAEGLSEQEASVISNRVNSYERLRAERDEARRKCIQLHDENGELRNSRSSISNERDQLKAERDELLKIQRGQKETIDDLIESEEAMKQAFLQSDKRTADLIFEINEIKEAAGYDEYNAEGLNLVDHVKSLGTGSSSRSKYKTVWEYLEAKEIDPAAEAGSFEEAVELGWKYALQSLRENGGAQ